MIELLVVIGIIGLLLAILLPTLGRARRSAGEIVCMNNLRQLGIGAMAYAAEFKGVIPWEGYAEGDRPERHLGPWEEPSVWFNAMPRYAKLPQYCDMQSAAEAGRKPLPREGDLSVFVCPEAGMVASSFGDDLIVDGYLMYWGLDGSGAPVQRKAYWCYGYNTKLDSGVEDRNVNFRVCIQLARIRKPSETALLVEKIMRNREISPPFTSSIAQQEVSWKEFTTRHRGGGYILMLDGHVVYFKRRELLAAPRAPFDYNQPGKIIWSPNTSAG